LISHIHKYLIYPIIFKSNGLRFYEISDEFKRYERDSYAGVESAQLAKLNALFSGPVAASGFYRAKYAASGIPGPLARLADLQSLPPLEKQEVNTLFASLPSDKSTVRDTAGTTGAPIRVKVDNGSLAHQVAARFHLLGWHGIELGDKEARFWGRPVTGRMFKLKDFLLNRKRYSFCSGVRSKDLLEYRSLLAYRPSYFYGYSSLILNAAKFWEREGLAAIPLKAIICTAEKIEQYQVDYIERVFGCPVILEYGCSESDIIAFQCEQRKLHVFSPNVLLELDHREGGTGEALVTDLNNRAMPLIRYRLGDRVTLDPGACRCGRKLPVLSDVKGRTLSQIIKTPKREIHVVEIAYAIEQVANRGFQVRRFKIIHDAGSLRINIDLSGDGSRFEEHLAPLLDKILCGCIAYEIRLVDIPADNTAKYSYFEIVRQDPA
jgi:phenylacetate-CoA ligase